MAHNELLFAFQVSETSLTRDTTTVDSSLHIEHVWHPRVSKKYLNITPIPT